MPYPTGQAARGRHWPLALAVLGLLVVAAVWPDLRRPGYSPDEEFTLFAVRGIAAHGLPLLPSGLLYDRGLAYSYASWLAGLASGHAVPAYRVVSLVAAALALWAIFRELRRLSSDAAAALAVVAIAASLPFWVSATTARFYAPFLLCYLVVLALLARPQLSWRGVAALAGAAAAARWTHELAFTLAAVPAAAVLLVASTERWTWVRRAAGVVGGLVAGQLAIFAVHALAPPSNGDVMVRRFFLWQVLNLFERPPLDLPRTLPLAALAGAVVASGLALARWRVSPASATLVLVGGTAAALGQLGVAPAIALAALPVAGAATRQPLVATALGVTGFATAFWLVALMAGGLDAGAAWTRVGQTGFVYPLDMFSYLVTESPWLIGAVLTLLLARSAGRGGPWHLRERALHALWMGWVLWFGVIESGITQRYLLLPVTFMLAALALDVGAVAVRASGRWRRLAPALAVGVVLVVSLESWWGTSGGERRWVVARPTLDVAAVAPETFATDLIACTDELACVIAVGRVDAWLVLDDFFRERFVVMRAEAPTGTYTGAPASSALLPLLQRAERERRRLMVVD
ncbi:MAG TPA: hypothetical protein VMW48_07220, partial [Vicinamibacterales bacterium]|nr:hypothetical protein [Vicinamibacterales bacterium]